MRSMTGFGRGAASTAAAEVSVEVRSVNGRHAEVRFRLPPGLAEHEARFRAQVRERVGRGRVDVSVNVDRTGGRPVSLKLNRELADEVAGVARRLQDDLDLDGSVDLRLVLQSPGVLETVSDRSGSEDEEVEAAAAALTAALDAHAGVREAEGARLATDLRERLESMAEHRAAIAALAPEEVQRLAERLRSRVADLAADVAVEPARLAQEVAFLADRADVSEELVRLESHLAEARPLLDPGNHEPVGRRLEFLLQEILREANTIGSKTGDLEIGRHARAIKSEMEKAREQVQNVE